MYRVQSGRGPNSQLLAILSHGVMDGVTSFWTHYVMIHRVLPTREAHLSLWCSVFFRAHSHTVCVAAFQFSVTRKGKTTFTLQFFQRSELTQHGSKSLSYITLLDCSVIAKAPRQTKILYQTGHSEGLEISQNPG